MPSSQVEAALVTCGLRPDARAQDLSLGDFVGVHRALGEQVGGTDDIPVSHDHVA